MLKHQINCLIHPHLHPQGDDESVRFVLEAKDPAQRTAPDFRAFRRPPQDYRIGVDIIANAAKAQASVATFKILTRYAPLAGQAYEIASFARKGGWIRSVLGAVGIEVKPRHYLEFDPQGDGYRGAALGRLRRDMYRQGGG
jgi:hypothetical protein